MSAVIAKGGNKHDYLGLSVYLRESIASLASRNAVIAQHLRERCNSIGIDWDKIWVVQYSALRILKFD